MKIWLYPLFFFGMLLVSCSQQEDNKSSSQQDYKRLRLELTEKSKRVVEKMIEKTDTIISLENFKVDSIYLFSSGYRDSVSKVYPLQLEMFHESIKLAKLRKKANDENEEVGAEYRKISDFMDVLHDSLVKTRKEAMKVSNTDTVGYLVVISFDLMKYNGEMKSYEKLPVNFDLEKNYVEEWDYVFTEDWFKEA